MSPVHITHGIKYYHHLIFDTFSLKFTTGIWISEYMSAVFKKPHLIHTYVTPLSLKSFARPTFILDKICLIIEIRALAYFAFSDNIFLLFFSRNICLISCSIYLCYFCRYIGLISPAGCREQSFAGDFPGRLFFDRQRRGQSKNNGRSPKIFRKKSKKSSGRNPTNHYYFTHLQPRA